MQKLSPGYIISKLILFVLFEAVGVCLSFMALQVAEKSALDPQYAHALAGAVGLAVWCVLTYRMIKTAKLDKITKLNYLLGEGITALVFLTFAVIVCAVMGGFPALYDTWVTVLFLPMLPFACLLNNLYVGTVLQLAFCVLFVWICYEIKRKKDPALLGRAKKAE